MYKFLLLLALVAWSQQLDPPTDQLVIYKEKTKTPVGTLTTSSGMPVEERDTRSTLNTNLYANEYFMDKMNYFIREKIPERIVHTKASGALGYFETLDDISQYCKAELFSEVGKKTPVIARFSVGVTDKGGPDTQKTPMGFALKFYTKEGNLDLLGLNTPVFAMKDPNLFQPLIHALKRNPVTNLADVNMLWDFVTSNPTSILMFLMLLGERGIPLTYRHMPGYFIHTFEIYNAKGEKSFVRFQFLPDAGIKFMNTTEGAATAGSNLDYYTGDLYRNIGNGNYPSWTLYAQILSPDDVKNATFDVFDLTKQLPEKIYKPRRVGRLVLNENPTNYFAQIEQLTLGPHHLVPGMSGSPDKAYEARLMFYRHAHAYRLGVNHNTIPVNCPYRTKTFTYNRDGFARVDDNGSDGPNYFRNYFNGPQPCSDKNRPPLSRVYQDDSDNFDQAKEYYEQMDTEDKNSFVKTAVGTLCLAANGLQDRAVTAFAKIHPNLSADIAKALKENNCKH